MADLPEPDPAPTRRKIGGPAAVVAVAGPIVVALIALSLAAPAGAATYPPAPGPWTEHYQSLPPTDYGTRYGIECVERLGGDLRSGKGKPIPMCSDVAAPVHPRPRPWLDMCTGTWVEAPPADTETPAPIPLPATLPMLLAGITAIAMRKK